MAMIPRILALGDSHSTFWRGCDSVHGTGSVFRGVDVLYLGAITAHQMFASGTAGKSIRALKAHMQANHEAYGLLMTCLGEIDCRVHLVRSAIENGISIQAAAAITAKNYFTFLEWLREEYRIPIIIWAPVATSQISSKYPMYPSVGTVLERNYATVCFIETLREMVMSQPLMEVVSIFDNQIDIAGNTRKGIHYDGFHASILAHDYAVPAVKDALEKLNLPHLAVNLQRVWQVADTPSVVNLAAGLLPSVRPLARGERVRALKPRPDGRVAFRTLPTPNPMVILDLEFSHVLAEIRFHVPTQNDGENARSIQIDVSQDGVAYEPFYRPSSEDWRAFGPDCPLILPWPGKGMARRFLKFYLLEEKELAVDTIVVDGPVFAKNLFR